MDRFARRREATLCEKMGTAEFKNREGLLGIVMRELDILKWNARHRLIHGSPSLTEVGHDVQQFKSDDSVRDAEFS